MITRTEELAVLNSLRP